MEQCGHHSGIAVLQTEHERRLNEYRENITRVHARLDETNKLITDMRDEMAKKLRDYSVQMAEQYADTMKVFSDPKQGVILGDDGLQSRVDDLRRDMRLNWRLWGMCGTALLAIIGFCANIFFE